MTIDKVRAPLDAVVVGAGFSGLYMLKRLRDDLGLAVRGIEAADGVGGTWWWNCYPGARCDAESIYYSYGFDSALQEEWTWSERYAAQPEILGYAEHVAERFGLLGDISLGTRVVSATWDEDARTWSVACDTGVTMLCRYLVSAVGCLSAPQVPELSGQADFTGPVLHTGLWPREGVDLRGKRVAVIGTGSSGIQLIPELARTASSVTVFQRTPHFSVPARNRPLSADEVANVKADYPALRALCRTTPAGTALQSAEYAAGELTEAEREDLLRERWSRGGPGIVGVFNDVMTDSDSNDSVASFVRARISEVVDDPAVAALLTPTDYPIGTKRICIDTGYFESFNRENVRLVSLRETPIERITAHGVLAGGVTHPSDAIIYATGFDAITGPLNRIEIRGRGGRLLREKWASGPRTYLGIAVAGFPNLFTLTGPGSPSVLTNMMTSIEQHVELIVELIGCLLERGVAAAEPTTEAEDDWVDQVNRVAEQTLYPRAASWYVGANIPGKSRVFMPYAGGVGSYGRICADIAAAGFEHFHEVPPRHVPAADGGG